jgi:hypothetical protein
MAALPTPQTLSSNALNANPRCFIAPQLFSFSAPRKRYIPSVAIPQILNSLPPQEALVPSVAKPANLISLAPGASTSPQRRRASKF